MLTEEQAGVGVIQPGNMIWFKVRVKLKEELGGRLGSVTSQVLAHTPSSHLVA